MDQNEANKMKDFYPKELATMNPLRSHLTFRRFKMEKKTGFLENQEIVIP